jgi:hypothetical protein
LEGIVILVNDLRTPDREVIAMRRNVAVLPCLLLVTALVAVPATGLDAQSTGTRVGIGYVANAPDLMAGGSAMVLVPALGGIGVYVDAKFNTDSPRRDETFYADWTALQVEDEVPGVRFHDVQDSYRSVNVAVVRPVTPALMLYVGAGLTHLTRYRQYRDPEEELGRAGYFWVEGPDEASDSANLLVGAFLRISPRMSMQTGFESNPKGFTVGASILFPPR